MGTIVMVCVILSIYYAQARDYDPHAQYGAHERECFVELDLDVYKINNAFGSYMHVQEGDPDVNNFMACSWRKIGSLNENGDVDFGSMWSDLSQQAYKMFGHNSDENTRFVNDVVNDCKHVQGYSYGDLVVKVHNCINDHFF